MSKPLPMETKRLKTFKDLKFGPHMTGIGLQARMKFPNGYGVSVVRFRMMFGGYGSYTSSDKEWELAVLHGDDLCYSTPITNDVIGHLTDRKVTNIMKRVQALRKKRKCPHRRRHD